MSGLFTCINIGFWQGPFPKSGLDKMLVFPMIGFGRFSFVDLLCFFCLVFALFLCASFYMCFVVTCWERADLLALVCGV